MDVISNLRAKSFMLILYFFLYQVYVSISQNLRCVAVTSSFFFFSLSSKFKEVSKVLKGHMKLLVLLWQQMENHGYSHILVRKGFKVFFLSILVIVMVLCFKQALFSHCSYLIM